MTRPVVVLFDVNETLSDPTRLAGRFGDVGLPEQLLPLWFASVLRDGFALTVVGRSVPFVDIAGASLRTVLAEHASDRGADEAVQHVLGGFSSLPVHPDVVPGVRALAASGQRLATLSNGSAQVADTLLSTAGVRDAFERLLSVDDAGLWKPAAQAYAYAVEQCGVPAHEVMLVAVHPWDVEGARRAGLRTAWISRVSGTPWPEHFAAPEVTASGVDDLARQLDEG